MTTASRSRVRTTSQRTPRTAPLSLETAAIQMPLSVSAPRQTPGAEACLAVRHAPWCAPGRTSCAGPSCPRREAPPPSLGPQVFSNSHGCWHVAALKLARQPRHPSAALQLGSASGHSHIDVGLPACRPSRADALDVAAPRRCRGRKGRDLTQAAKRSNMTASASFVRRRRERRSWSPCLACTACQLWSP